MMFISLLSFKFILATKLVRNIILVFERSIWPSEAFKMYSFPLVSLDI